jgi:hypothetical protein
VLAEDDKTVLAAGLAPLLGPEVEVVLMPGTNGLSMEGPAEVARAILAARETTGPRLRPQG